MARLMDGITVEALLEQAAELRRRGFRPGCDDMSARSAELWLRINGARLLAELRSGSYRPMPVLGYRCAKRDGGVRTLTRATAIDTVAQRCLLAVLTPVCEAHFADESCAFRPGRGVSEALRRYGQLGSAHRWAARIDPSDCFGSMDHTVLAGALADFFPDEKLVRQLLRFAQMPLWEDGSMTERRQGVPQGSPLGPLLCNIYLDALDRFLGEQGLPFVRYADDVVLFGNDRAALQEAQERTIAFMQTALKLKANDRKCALHAPFQLRYLGSRFSVDKDGFLVVGTDESLPAAYHAWKSGKLRDTGRSVHLLSDGILRQRDYTLLLDAEDGNYDIPAENTDCINVFSNVVFDSGFLLSAAAHGIVVNLFDRQGHLRGRFLPNVPLTGLPITREQLAAYHDAAHRLSLARAFVLGALHNLRLNIRYYNKNKPDALYDETLDALRGLEREIKGRPDYQSLLLLEARVRGAYYRCFDRFLAESGFRFEKRSRRPPRNEVNALLSFGNTVLYSYLATEISKTALDVRVGFLHATNRRMESLNLDLAELFKPLLVDRTVFRLINRKQLRPDRHFERLEDGAVWLNAEGKRLFLEKFHDKLHSRVTDHDQSKSYVQLMTEEVHKLARHFRNGEPYKPFKQIR